MSDSPVQSSFPERGSLNLPDVASEILKRWERENTFQRSIDSRPEDRPYVFFEGPPSANGKPGIHHVMARAIKDIFCRFHTLKGYRVERKAGWDTHGLPVELGVEKELGITKEDIEEVAYMISKAPQKVDRGSRRRRSDSRRPWSGQVKELRISGCDRRYIEMRRGMSGRRHRQETAGHRRPPVRGA